MTSTPVPDAAVQIAWKTLADFLGPDRYRAEQVVDALAAAGWLDDPERRAARQADHDAVVAERDALAELRASVCDLCNDVRDGRPIVYQTPSFQRLADLIRWPAVPHE